MNKYYKALSVALILVLLLSVATGCSGVIDESKYDYTVSTLTSAYESMLARSNLAARYSLYGTDTPETLNIEFGSMSGYVYGVQSVLENEKTTSKTFYKQNNIWYLNDGKSKIAVAAPQLEAYLWMVEMTVTDYRDLLACVNPARILARNFTVDPFVITKTQGSLVSLYTVTLNSSFMDKRELFVNGFYNTSMGDLVDFDGSIEYYVEISGMLQEIRLELNCTYSKSDTVYRVVLSIRQINGVYRMPEDELKGYEVR